MSMLRMADALRKLIREERSANVAEMEKGKEPLDYRELVGRNKQLKKVNDWVNHLVGELEEPEDEL